MGLFSFIKGAGEKLFSNKEEEAPVAEKATLKANALLNHVKALGLAYKTIKISLKSDNTVLVEGEVENQSDAEKITLAVGNVDSVEGVENTMIVVVPAPEAKFHAVVSGDTLSKISKTYYGDANQYNVIFEANKPMLSHPDKIYVGQILRIPNLD
ncbi:MAG: peptidoglycan-binding protein LysM [Flavobacterium sp.]